MSKQKGKEEKRKGREQEEIRAIRTHLHYRHLSEREGIRVYRNARWNRRRKDEKWGYGNHTFH